MRFESYAQQFEDLILYCALKDARGGLRTVFILMSAPMTPLLTASRNFSMTEVGTA